MAWDGEDRRQRQEGDLSTTQRLHILSTEARHLMQHLIKIEEIVKEMQEKMEAHQQSVSERIHKLEIIAAVIEKQDLTARIKAAESRLEQLERVIWKASGIVAVVSFLAAGAGHKLFPMFFFQPPAIVSH